MSTELELNVTYNHANTHYDKKKYEVFKIFQKIKFQNDGVG